MSNKPQYRILAGIIAVSLMLGAIVGALATLTVMGAQP